MMKRPANKVGQQPNLWLLFVLRLRKCFKLQYLLTIFIFLLLSTYLRIINHAPLDQSILSTSNTIIQEEIELLSYPHSNNCNFDQTEFILHYNSSNNNSIDDDRPKPTIERLIKLFKILISHEDKYRQVFDYLNIFRFTDIYNTLRPFANDTQRFNHIYCLFQRYITISDNGHIDITPNLITYLKQVSNYLSDGLRNQHLHLNKTLENNIQKKPVIILAASLHFYETMQASMRTVGEYLKNYTVAIYNLGLTGNQLNMIKENCERCIIIPFPFAEIEPVAGHVRNLGYFAWKPIIIQDAVRRFGTIIYGDTSVRYKTSNFDHLLIDNLIRGFACRELPGHYLPCFTLSGTFSWFNETYSSFNDIYIAEAGFLAVTDNFLSRLILKTWVTCALDSNCIVPSNSETICKRKTSSTRIHRYDQSAMVAALSFYFFPSPRQSDKSDPAPYDMYASIQTKIAEVRRFEGEKNYFTRRNNLIV